MDDAAFHNVVMLLIWFAPAQPPTIVPQYESVEACKTARSQAGLEPPLLGKGYPIAVCLPGPGFARDQRRLERSDPNPQWRLPPVDRSSQSK